MRWVWIAASLTLAWTFATSIPDFDERTEGYEFIYHESNDLLLVVKDECFYCYLEDSSTKYLMTTSNRRKLENKLVKILQQTERSWDQNQGSNGVLFHPSSLDQVRDKFTDRLADFHCLDKDIHEVYFLNTFFRHLDRRH